MDLKRTYETFELPKLSSELIDLTKKEKKAKKIKDKYYQRKHLWYKKKSTYWISIALRKLGEYISKNYSSVGSSYNCNNFLYYI